MLDYMSSLGEENVYQEAFDMLDMVDTGKEGSTYIEKIKWLIKHSGLSFDDPRLSAQISICKEMERQKKDLDLETFKEVFQPCFTMMKKIINYNFTYSDYKEKYEQAKKVFDEVKAMDNLGFIPDYIPALSDVDEDGFGVSICTVDGQFINLGDFNEKTCMHAISGVVSY